MDIAGEIVFVPQVFAVASHIPVAAEHYACGGLLCDKLTHTSWSSGAG